MSTDAGILDQPQPDWFYIFSVVLWIKVLLPPPTSLSACPALSHSCSCLQPPPFHPLQTFLAL